VPQSSSCRPRLRCSFVIGEVRSFHSPDLEDVDAWVPPDPDRFGFLLQVMIGPKGGEGEESFSIQVCSPGWLADRYVRDGIVMGRHHLIVFEYDIAKIKAFISKFVSLSPAATWVEVAAKIGRLGHWEFEDYDDRRPYTP